MNKVLTHADGHPIKNTDINIVQDAVFLAVRALASSIQEATTETMFVISGCVPNISGGNITISDGIVVIDGELLEYATQTIPYNPAKYYYFEVQAVETNPRVYANAVVSKNCTEIRTAIVVEHASILPLRDVFDIKRYADLLQLASKQALEALESAWINIFALTISLTAVGGTASFSTGTTTLSYKKVGKTVSVRFTVSIISTAAQHISMFSYPLPSAISGVVSVSQPTNIVAIKATSGISYGVASATSAGIVEIESPTPSLYFTNGEAIEIRGTIILELV